MWGEIDGDEEIEIIWLNGAVSSTTVIPLSNGLNGLDNMLQSQAWQSPPRLHIFVRVALNILCRHPQILPAVKSFQMR